MVTRSEHEMEFDDFDTGDASLLPGYRTVSKKDQMSFQDDDLNDCVAVEVVCGCHAARYKNRKWLISAAKHEAEFQGHAPRAARSPVTFAGRSETYLK
nr:hypothetical protein CFP56_63980 [Quercus suber]